MGMAQTALSSGMLGKKGVMAAGMLGGHGGHTGKNQYCKINN